MKVSVVLPAKNEARNIAHTLDALAAQSLPKSDFEVILADNGSSDDTISIAETYSSALNLKIVPTRATTIAQVRNDGAAAAVGQILAFLDSDCTAQPGWLEQAIAERPTESIWGAHYTVPHHATWVGKLWEEFQATSQTGETKFLPTSNLFVTRTDFTRIGGFASSQQTSEDVDFSMRARRLNLRVVAIPALAVIHEETPSTLSQFFRQNYWHGKHVVRMFVRNLPSTRSLPVVALSFYFLLALLAVITTCFVAIKTHNTLPLLISVGMLLLPALSLSIKKTVSANRLAAAPALAVLYMTYLTARALSIIFPAARKHR